MMDKRDRVMGGAVRRVARAFAYGTLVAGIGAFTLGLASCGGGSGDKLNEDKPADQSAATSGTGNATGGSNLHVELTAANIQKGHDIYQKTCSPCHGTSGKGDGPAAAALNPKPRDHTDGAYMDKLTDDHIYTVIKQGGGAFGKPTMPANPQLSDDDTKAVIAYVRSLSPTYAKK